MRHFVYINKSETSAKVAASPNVHICRCVFKEYLTKPQGKYKNTRD